MTIQPGEFWIANIPFTNGLSSKKRPVLVLWTDGNDAIVALVTSALPRTETDSMLNDWHSSGLRTASTVRLSRLDCLEQSLLLSKLGTISAADAEQAKEIWQLYIKPQF
jgi:mRNA interferase MazF